MWIKPSPFNLNKTTIHVKKVKFCILVFEIMNPLVTKSGNFTLMWMNGMLREGREK